MITGTKGVGSESSPEIAPALRATHPFGVLDHAPVELWTKHGIDHFLHWPLCLADVCVVALDVASGRTVIVEGKGLREEGSIYLPEGGRLMVEGSGGTVTLPAGIYNDLDAPVLPDTPALELPNEPWKPGEMPPRVEQAESGRRWIEASRSTLPLPPRENLFRLCRDFYEAEPVLGALTEVCTFATWTEYTAAANASVSEAKLGLEIIRRLVLAATVEVSTCAKWIQTEKADTALLLNQLSVEAWRIKTDVLAQGLNGFYHESFDLRPVIPTQHNAELAWVMETALARGQPYLPKLTTAALLAIWRNVGAFLPLRNGRAFVCARFENLCGGQPAGGAPLSVREGSG
jgi:hypothetical protein